MASSFPISADGMPIIQGIELVSTHQLPDRLRQVFKHPLFNPVQSRCFDTVFQTDNNFVLSAPTGSGKTAILELAICRLVVRNPSHRFKIVYQAPTRSLCSERQRDWQMRFNHLGLTCAELTGDTEHNQLRNVQNADVIITTPEKWDSMTRKWRDHARLMELVKLFIIDEVHILKEDRGACLEAVVSRMKSVGSNVRLIALSATVPNSEDIATWLGRNNTLPNMPAAREVFGDEFRPVKLQKHVFDLQSNGCNDFAFEQSCNSKLPEVIAKYGVDKKPIMIFCFTRKSTETTANILAQWWYSSAQGSRYWAAPSKVAAVANEALKKCVSSGVAFHHAGLDAQDRAAVEAAYLRGDINVICCTSTLAIGINLPCHFVIIKNTVSYQTEGCKEYSDLEIMQMLGRAGRPQFDHSAVAVIMTRTEKANRYLKMVSGQEILESRLHENLIDHLNAEIGLGTIQDSLSARLWLESTFFFVRFCKNPGHYRLNGSTLGERVSEIVDRICNRDIDSLRECSLITDGLQQFKSTELGDAMARYYVHYPTMRLFLGLQSKPKISEILSVIAQAAEFKPIRFRSGEKQMFKEINASSSIRFPIKVDLALAAHKVSLIIQTALGGHDLRHDARFASQGQQFQADSSLVFQHVHRLIRCIIDCQLHLEDSIGARNALELARSLGARAWDDSPLQLMQIEKIGPVAMRKLLGAGIKTVEDLQSTEACRIDGILSRAPPFGMQLLMSLKNFPHLRVSLKMMGQPVSRLMHDGKCWRAHIKAEMGFLNETPPSFFMRKAIHVILLAERSDGRMVHFSRISGQKLGNGQDITFTVDLTSAQQIINCYLSCDEIAGTLKHASLQPNIPTSAFAPNMTDFQPRIALRNIESNKLALHGRASTKSEDFGEAELPDSDLVAIEDTGFHDIDEVDATFSGPPPSQRQLAGTGKLRKPSRQNSQQGSTNEDGNWHPTQLANGKWDCSHKCKNKRTCKHLCCREGLDKPPKPPKLSKKWEPDSNLMIDSTMKQKTATDFFNQSKAVQTSSKTHSKAQNAHSTQANLPARHDSLVNGSPDPFDEAFDFLDDYVEPNATSLATVSTNQDINRSTAKGQGLFLTDTSSPEKPQQVSEIDLSYESPKKRPADLTATDLQMNNRTATAAPFHSKKQRLQRVFVTSPGHKFVTLSQLDKSVPSLTFEDRSPPERAGNGQQASSDESKEEIGMDSGYDLDDTLMDSIVGSANNDMEPESTTSNNPQHSFNPPVATGNTDNAAHASAFGLANGSLLLAVGEETDNVNKDNLESEDTPEVSEDVDAWLKAQFGDLVDFV